MAYKISDSCISCGSCASECPVGAISEGDAHYEIIKIKKGLSFDGPFCFVFFLTIILQAILYLIPHNPVYQAEQTCFSCNSQRPAD